jgi:hypothetical protein
MNQIPNVWIIGAWDLDKGENYSRCVDVSDAVIIIIGRFGSFNTFKSLCME